MYYGTRVHPYKVFPNVKAIVEFAKKIEDLGYDYLTLPHHTIFPASSQETLSPIWYDPIVMGAHLSAHTTTLRFNYSVLVLPQYNPIELAKQLASVDAVSGGRIGVGVGVGWCEEEFGWLGQNWKNRGRRMEECIAVLKEIWTNDPTSFKGEFYEFEEACVQPKPVQSPHPPIYVGGGKPSIDRAARLGDGWMPISNAFEPFLEDLEELKVRLKEHGRDASTFHVIRHLPMFELAPWINQHVTHKAGGHREEPLNGDYGRARDTIALCEERGVTHMTALFMTEYEPMVAELDVFAKEIIGRSGA
jgi:probable F420-dependent oxidoreductase